MYCVFIIISINNNLHFKNLNNITNRKLIMLKKTLYLIINNKNTYNEQNYI